MKKITIAALLLILVLVVAPWGIGQLAEQRVNAGLDRLVAQAPYLTIAERKWTRGWFRSEQQVTFEVLGAWMHALDPGNTAGVPLRFTVRNEILHGPVLWPASLGIARSQAEASRLLLSLLQGSALLKARRPKRVQDPLSFRCLAPVSGAAFDQLTRATTALDADLNGAGDSPAVLLESEQLMSTVNFDTTATALAFESLGLALSHAAAISVCTRESDSALPANKVASSIVVLLKPARWSDQRVIRH